MITLLAALGLGLVFLISWAMLSARGMTYQPSFVKKDGLIHPAIRLVSKRGRVVRVIPQVNVCCTSETEASARADRVIRDARMNGENVRPHPVYTAAKGQSREAELAVSK